MVISLKNNPLHMLWRANKRCTRRYVTENKRLACGINVHLRRVNRCGSLRAVKGLLKAVGQITEPNTVKAEHPNKRRAAS